MDLNELYKEIEKAEVDLNAKRLKYIKEALVENGGSIKLKFKEFKEFKETNDAFDFDDQFPVIIEIAGIPMYLTEVYVKKNDFRIVLLDYDDMTLGDYDNTGENEQVAYFINYCLNQDKNKIFILGTRKTGCDLIVLGGTNCDEGSMNRLFGSLGNENFYVYQPLSLQKSSQEIEKVNPLYALKVATAYFREQGKVPVFEDSNCRLIKL